MVDVAWERARGAPWNYGAWTELLAVLEEEGDPARLRLAYEEILMEFPQAADAW